LNLVAKFIWLSLHPGGWGPSPRDQATRVPRAERVTGTARTATG